LVVELLVQGSDVFIVDNNGNSCLHFAAQNQHRAVVEVLLRYGADPSIPNASGLVAVEMTNNPAVTELFMRDKGNIFSPVVQAKRLFAEYLSSQSHSENSKATTTDGNGGDLSQGSSGVKLNLEEELNESFTNLSLQQ
jgi:hypothetical protein